MIGDYVRTREKAQQEGGAYICVRVTSKRTNIFVAVEMFYLRISHILPNELSVVVVPIHWRASVHEVFLLDLSFCWGCLTIFLNEHFRERNHSK